MPTPETKLLLTVDEAAARLSVSRAYLYKRISSGELPSVHFGGRRIRVADLEAYVERLAAENGTAPSMGLEPRRTDG